MSRKLTYNDFLQRAFKAHGYLYDYSKVVYVNNSTKVIIKCKIHGDFEIRPSNHLSGYGCAKCGYLRGGSKISDNIKKNRAKLNINNLDKNSSYVPLGKNGQYAIVDSVNYNNIIQHNWNISAGYAYNRKLGYMHRYIKDYPEKMDIDHKNKNKLDNRKSNLRVCTRSQNNLNTDPKKGTSIYKGVYFNKKTQKWVARISINYKGIHIGSFLDETEAAKAYDEKAIELFGEFANTNF